MPYIPYTDEQKQLANSVDLPTFLRMRGETVVPVGREFKLVYHDGYGKHDSITISSSQWYDHKNQIGGDPIKFMQEHYGMSFQEAMQALLGHSALPLTHEIQPVMAKEKKEFRLPEPNDNMHRVYAYLIKQRHIAPEVITHFAKKKLLYEDKKHHNAVFVGTDGNGIPRQAHKRSATTFGNSFRQTIEGSDTKYSFAHFGKSNMLTMQVYAAGDVSGAIESTWNDAKSQIKTIVNNVVFPVLDVVLVILLFVKIGTLYLEYRKHGQFEWTPVAIIFGCLLFTLTAPLYIWNVVGL